MAVAHGKHTRIYLNGYNLTGFFRKSSSELTRETHQSTVFGLDDHTYLAGVKDATASLEGLFDGVADGVEEALLAALNADPTILTILPQGDALGNVAHGFTSLETKYAIDSSKDDIVSLNAEWQSNAGRDRLLVQHALGSEVASGQSASIDNGALTANGGVGFLHVPDIAGITNLSVLIEDSADNSAWATILTFAGVTADRGRQRIEISGTVRRYTRSSWVFTGSGSSQFWAGFGRR